MSAIEAETASITIDDVTLEFLGPLNDHIMLTMRDGTLYEYPLLRDVKERYGTGGVYVDIGACIGTHSVFFNRLCKADLVSVIEPNAAAWPFLSANLHKNIVGEIDCFGCAVGSEPGRVTVVPFEGNIGGNSTEPTDALTGSIPRVRASALITTKPKLIKIDCEAANYDVLLGCEDVILDAMPILALEMAPGTDDILRKLGQWGYKCASAYKPTPLAIWEPRD